MKKKSVKVLAAIAILIAIAICVCFLYKPLFYRLYLKDRITGDLRITVDGQAVSLDESNFSIVSFAKGDHYSIKEKDNATHVSILGGAYGGYTLGVTVPNFSETIQLKVMQGNWWNVETFDVTVNIDTKTNELSYTYFSTSINEDGSKCTDNGTVTRMIGEDELVIHISSI